MMTIMRGLPGSGKSTKARQLADDNTVICSADDHFMVDGEYVFNPDQIGAAHQACQDKARKALMDGKDVIIDNTNTQKWEMQPYLDMAAFFKVTLEVVNIFDGGCSDEELVERNSHGVPIEAIRRMRARWE
jgi:predicted kinase